jgi:hypothetical protein
VLAIVLAVLAMLFDGFGGLFDVLDSGAIRTDSHRRVTRV